MAVKKLKLDFSKVTERSGWNTAHMEEGLYLMKIVEVSDAPAGDGGDMLTYALVPVEKKYASRRFPYFCKIQENQYFKIRDLLVAAGVKVPASVATIDPNKPVGQIVAAELIDGRGQYSDRSEINGIYAASVIEDDAPSSASDDDEADEEEYDEDEVDSDEEEMSEEEEELREELEGLTLVKLRKRAKDLGIATTGISQDDLIELIVEQELEEDEEEEPEEDEEEEDEDLGDEELEDEEFDEEEDEEEEEPEPAPRARRAAAKPAAKKTAAKPAAKAAPATTRRVKRR